MKIPAALLAILFASPALAERPIWTEIGKTPEGWAINLAFNKQKTTGKDTLTIPLCIDNALKKTECSTAAVDCGEWTLMQVQAGPRTVGDLILKTVCQK